jgi:hypothetical protein
LRLVVCVWVDRADEGSDSPTTSGDDVTIGAFIFFF